MARYSFTVYGSGAKYGQLENNRAYYNVNLQAISYDYQSVFIKWTSLLSDPSDVAAGFAPTHWKLLRSKSGASDSPYEGDVIASGTIGSYALNAVDTTVDPDTQTIYSFWIFNGREWINCGTTYVVSVADTVYPTLRKMEKWLPAAWLNETYGIGDAFGEPEPSDLTKVLSAYAFFYDKMRVETDILEQSVVYKKTPVQLLKNKLIDRGFTYEPTLGDAYHRGVYRASEVINAKKGTKTAVEGYVTALTHWGCRVQSGINLLLNYNDSSFEETTGNWGTSAGTIHAHKYATSLADVGVTVTAPSYLQGLITVNPNATFSPRTLGFMQLSGNGTSATTLSLPANGSDKVKYGIPVEEYTTYIFTGWVRVKEANKEATVKAKISWYDLNGTLISTTNDGTPITGTLTFAKFSSLSSTAPEGAKYASVTITVTNAHVTAQTFFDMLQFAEDTGSYEFQDARKVLVYVEGDKSNLIRNSSFETNTDYWTALNGTLTTSTTPAGAKVFGSKVGKLTVASTQIAAIVSEWIPVDPSENYTASAYVSGTAGKTAILRLEYSQLQSVEDQTRVLSDEAGDYYPTNFYYVDSAPITLTSTAQRIEVFALAPLQSTDAGTPSAKISIYMPDAEAGNLLYIDSCQLEDGVEATTYFDGTGAPVPTNPLDSEYIPVYECFWENETAGTGRSYRWNNYYTKLQRLAEGLPLVMPYGVSWEIRSGYPTPDYPELTPNILTSPSFERNTNGWNGTAATISRTVTRGSLFDEYTTHGIAFAKVTSTASSAFSIYSDPAVLDDTSGYYTSVALKPENEDAYGNYVLTVRYLDDDNVLVIQKQDTMLISNKDRWAYMATYARKYEIAGATKATVRVTCTPNTPGSGIVFYIDRVVFRQ